MTPEEAFRDVWRPHDLSPVRLFKAGWEAAIKAVKEGGVALKPKEYAWECNECGSQEYTMCVSEDDVNRLGCGNCGGDEWHKAEVRP